MLFILESLSPRILLVVSTHLWGLFSFLPFELKLRLLEVALILCSKCGGGVNRFRLSLNHLVCVCFLTSCLICGLLNFVYLGIQVWMLFGGENQGTYVRNVRTENSKLLPELPVREPFLMFKELLIQTGKKIWEIHIRCYISQFLFCCFHCKTCHKI